MVDISWNKLQKYTYISLHVRIIYIYIYIYIYVCVCVCVCERERDRERQRQRETMKTISVYLNTNETEVVSTLSGKLLDLVDQFTYLDSNISSTERNVNICIEKAWVAMDNSSIIWKWNSSDKIKRYFFQAGTTSVRLYGDTTWILTKLMEKKLDWNYDRILWDVLNKHLTNFHLTKKFK